MPEPTPTPEPNPTPEPTPAESDAAPDAVPPHEAAEAAAAGDPRGPDKPATAPGPKYEHPKRHRPDNWVESLRKKLRKDSCWRRQFDKLASPVGEPREFRVSESELVNQLTPTGGEEAERAARAAEILNEAQSIYRGAEDRAAGVTARATTLQEAVGIAATLLIAGAALIVGQSALQGTGWLVVFALLLVGATFSLVMSGLRALGAASTIHQWYEPSAEDIIDRSQKSEVEARVELAASLLWCYGFNSKVASWKVSYLGASAWWYRIALAFIVSIGMLVGIYAVVQTGQGGRKATATTVTATTTMVTTTTVTTTTSTRSTSTPAAAPVPTTATTPTP